MLNHLTKFPVILVEIKTLSSNSTNKQMPMQLHTVAMVASYAPYQLSDTMLKHQLCPQLLVKNTSRRQNTVCILIMYIGNAPFTFL